MLVPYDRCPPMRNTEGRTPCDNRGRLKSYGCQSRYGSPFTGSTALLTPCFWSSGFQHCEKINCSNFKPSTFVVIYYRHTSKLTQASRARLGRKEVKCHIPQPSFINSEAHTTPTFHWTPSSFSAGSRFRWKRDVEATLKTQIISSNISIGI